MGATPPMTLGGHGAEGSAGRRPGGGKIVWRRPVAGVKTATMAEVFHVVPPSLHDQVVTASYRHRGYTEDESAAATRVCSEAAREAYSAVPNAARMPSWVPGGLGYPGARAAAVVRSTACEYPRDLPA